MKSKGGKDAAATDLSETEFIEVEEDESWYGHHLWPMDERWWGWEERDREYPFLSQIKVLYYVRVRKSALSFDQTCVATKRSLLRIW